MTTLSCLSGCPGKGGLRHAACTRCVDRRVSSQGRLRGSVRSPLLRARATARATQHRRLVWIMTMSGKRAGWVCRDMELPGKQVAWPGEVPKYREITSLRRQIVGGSHRSVTTANSDTAMFGACHSNEWRLMALSGRQTAVGWHVREASESRPPGLAHQPACDPMHP